MPGCASRVARVVVVGGLLGLVACAASREAPGAGAGSSQQAAHDSDSPIRTGTRRTEPTTNATAAKSTHRDLSCDVIDADTGGYGCAVTRSGDVFCWGDTRNTSSAERTLRMTA